MQQTKRYTSLQQKNSTPTHNISDPNQNGRMSSAGGSGNNPGGSGGSGPGKQKDPDPSVPRTGPSQQDTFTVDCIRGTCKNPNHDHKGGNNYTYEKKK